MKTYHYLIKGRVQGVAFRYYAVHQAARLGVTGTVKNLYNGDVEVYAQGEEQAILRFEEFLQRGPSAARVDGMIKREFESEDVFPDFDLTY